MWTPKIRLKDCLGDKNQEHCTVFNMMRLVEFLFRHTREPEYLQYMEYNQYNGLMTQTYWTGEDVEGNPKKGLFTY